MIASPRAAALALALACSLLWPATSPAQDYPSRPVKIVVPFGAGGPADVFSRVLAQHLSDALKQPFVVEDRPGAGSIIGTDAVAKSPPDGYTLLAMSNTHTTNESLVPNKPFQLMRDFVPVAGINYSDLLMVIHPSRRRISRSSSPTPSRSRASSTTPRRARARPITWRASCSKP
jgi:tripartite-type tricarboxylate transporter receptor subunit TctC